MLKSALPTSMPHFADPLSSSVLGRMEMEHVE